MGSNPLGVQVANRLEREVRIDRAGAVADEQAEVMRFAGLAGFDDQAGLRARAFADQVMMDGGGGEQRGDRRVIGIDAAIGKNQDRCAIGDRLAGGGAEFVDGFAEAVCAFGDIEQHRQRDRAQIAGRQPRGAFPDRRCSGSAA